MKRIRLSRRFCPVTRALLAFSLSLISSIVFQAQSAADPATSPEAIQSRIQRARALIAAHQLQTAASELESVRAITQDSSLRSITSVMLMGVYLEEGNYGRAEALLEENFQSRSARSGDSLRAYFALAGQAVNASRTHLARYRSLGISITDSSLPPEVLSDLNRFRALLERMIAQAKEIAAENQAYDSLSLLEDVLGVRLSLAKDSEDQSKWEVEYASARQSLASSRTQIASLVGISALPTKKAPLAKTTSPSPYSTRRTPETDASEKVAAASEQQHPSKEPDSTRQPQTEPAPSSRAQPPAQTDNSTPVNSGSLNARAKKRVLPRYPPLAKQNGTVGLVRVYVVVDANGEVIEVSRSEGPVLLRRAAEEAAREWRFEAKPGAGSPTRISGYLEFNFKL